MNYGEMTHTELLKEFVKTFRKYDKLKDDELDFLDEHSNTDFWDDELEEYYESLKDDISLYYNKLEDMMGYIDTL